VARCQTVVVPRGTASTVLLATGAAPQPARRHDPQRRPRPQPV